MQKNPCAEEIFYGKFRDLYHPLRPGAHAGGEGAGPPRTAAGRAARIPRTAPANAARVPRAAPLRKACGGVYGGGARRPCGADTGPARRHLAPHRQKQPRRKGMSARAETAAETASAAPSARCSPPKKRSDGIAPLSGRGGGAKTYRRGGGKGAAQNFARRRKFRLVVSCAVGQIISWRTAAHGEPF